MAGASGKRNVAPPVYLDREDSPNNADDDDKHSNFDPVEAAEPSNSSKSLSASSKQAGNGIDRLSDIASYFERYSKTFTTRAMGKIRKVERDLVAQLKEAEKVKKDLRQEINRLQKRNEELVQATLQQAAKMGIDADSDDTIRDNFGNLMNRMNKWARKWTGDSFMTNVSKEVGAHIVQALTSQPFPSTTETALLMAFQQTLSNNTIVNALLIKHACERLVHDKFFFLQEVHSRHANVALSPAINQLFDLGHQVNPDQSKVWKSQTMILLHPKNAHDREAILPNGKPIGTAKTSHYMSVAQDFIHSKAVAPLLSAVDAETYTRRRQQLMEIITDFGELVLRLGTQKEDLRVVGYGAESMMRFRDSSEDIRPHPTLQYMEGSKRLDDQPILLVVEPRILAYGDRYGKNYNKHKVWHAAKVIIHDVNRITKPTTTEPILRRNTPATQTVPSRSQTLSTSATDQDNTAHDSNSRFGSSHKTVSYATVSDDDEEGPGNAPMKEDHSSKNTLAADEERFMAELGDFVGSEEIPDLAARRGIKRQHEDDGEGTTTNKKPDCKMPDHNVLASSTPTSEIAEGQQMPASTSSQEETDSSTIAIDPEQPLAHNNDVSKKTEGTAPKSRRNHRRVRKPQTRSLRDSVGITKAQADQEIEHIGASTAPSS